MASILDGLNIAKLALSAQQYAMNVTQRNTVNVNNPGYTRQDVIFTDLTVPSNWAASITPGVDIWAVRNSYLDQSISYELPALGENLVKYNSLREIDAIFQGTGGGGLGSSIAEFFDSFTELSSNPTNAALRWQVISRAETMSRDFHRIYTEIQHVQSSANLHVISGIEDVNNLTARIADLNGRIESAVTLGQKETEYALRDERQERMEELQSKLGVLYFETEHGSYTVTTMYGDALVLGKTSYNLTFGDSSNPDSQFPDIYLGNKNITSIYNATSKETTVMLSGEIGGYLKVRDELIPGYLNQLDEMAEIIIDKVNAQHNLGVGIDDPPSTSNDFFKAFTSARNIEISADILNDPNKIAAALSGYGLADNQNAKLLAQIGIDEKFGEKYAELIYVIGSDQKTAKVTGENQQNLLGQLLGQRNAESSVSLNEEAINLIKFQRAYQASSRIVTVLNTLSAEILNFVG